MFVGSIITHPGNHLLRKLNSQLGYGINALRPDPPISSKASPPQKLLPYLSSLLKILCKTSKSWGFSPSNETVSLTSATIYCHGIYFLFFLLGLKYLNSPGNLMLSQYTRLIQLLPVIMVTVTTHHITNTSPSLSITSSY